MHDYVFIVRKSLMCVFLYFAESNGWCTWWEMSFPKGTAFRVTFSNKKDCVWRCEACTLSGGEALRSLEEKYKGVLHTFNCHTHIHTSHVEKQTKSRRYQNQDAATDMVKLLNSWVTPRTHYKASCCSFINTATSLLPSSPTSQLQQLLIYLHLKPFIVSRRLY